jgi:hypothetical protein
MAIDVLLPECHVSLTNGREKPILHPASTLGAHHQWRVLALSDIAVA